MNNEKKIVLFLVEGKHDADEILALVNSPLFSGLTNKYAFYTHQFNGDVTADPASKDTTIVNRIENEVRKFIRLGVVPGLRPRDFKAVIHIVDMDGAFVSKEKIHQADVGNVMYLDDTIECFNPQVIIGRNNKKKKVLKKLYSIPQMCGIEYRIYYASCNMDHVLFNQRNPSRKDKNDMASQFSWVCENNPERIRELLNEQIFLHDYEESWKKVSEEGDNSLSRLANFTIALECL